MALYICYECEGQTAAPIDPATVDPAVLAALQGGAVPEPVRSVLLDERVEAFVWPAEAQNSAGTPKEDQTYYAFECNYDGLALSNKAQFGARMDFSWGADACAFASQRSQPPPWIKPPPGIVVCACARARAT